MDAQNLFYVFSISKTDSFYTSCSRNVCVGATHSLGGFDAVFKWNVLSPSALVAGQVKPHQKKNTEILNFELIH